ncbi:hypothetical protein pEaSNUABM55_00217 [Erwinia phage pEa_SNUABM_55]|nr:hypothetical protein pEaSNUABM55_00217 [Erwinia phage pEa_SNUABM_55]
MNIQFFANRTLAREAAKAAGVKTIDNGKDAAPGKRWAIEVPDCVQAAFNETANAHADWQKNNALKVEVSTVPAAPLPAPALKIDRALLSVRHPNGKRFPGRRKRQTMVIGHQGNKIPVTWCKSRDLVAA